MTKSGFIAIVGKPNVGKSTLLNALIGEKIAITSPKVQTTRFRITGILSENENQFVFIDTPGMHKPYHGLGKSMDKSASDALLDADLIMWVVDQSFKKTDELILNRIKDSGLPVILVINKIDELEKKSDIDQIIVSYLNKHEFNEIIPISAREQTHLVQLKNALSNYLIEGPHYYPSDYKTDQTDESRMSEIIRERILYYTEQEVPHSVAVMIESMKINSELKTLDVDALIIVERDSQKGILIGKNGEKLKRIGTEARKEINKIFELKVHLSLWVKVKKDWRNDPSTIARYGYGK
ncbi:GTPase Era [Acholeplasma granularum]|uniref:GTPase Era n=1 Tax=Acholeplasma granularum TaxID=264635 RepID=UPI00047196C4|nr:GTPase Era [Acholeplasma granularum]